MYTLTVGISMIEPKLSALTVLHRRTTLSAKERLQRDSFFSCIGNEVFMKVCFGGATRIGNHTRSCSADQRTATADYAAALELVKVFQLRHVSSSQVMLALVQEQVNTLASFISVADLDRPILQTIAHSCEVIEQVMRFLEVCVVARGDSMQQYFKTHTGSSQYLELLVSCIELMQYSLERIFFVDAPLSEGGDPIVVSDSKGRGMQECILAAKNQVLVTLTVHLQGPCREELGDVPISLFEAVAETLDFYVQVEEMSEVVLDVPAAQLLLVNCELLERLLASLITGAIDPEVRVKNAFLIMRNTIQPIAKMMELLLLNAHDCMSAEIVSGEHAHIDKSERLFACLWANDSAGVDAHLSIKALADALHHRLGHEGPKLAEVAGSAPERIFAQIIDVYCNYMSLVYMANHISDERQSMDMFRLSFSTGAESCHEYFFRKFIGSVEIVQEGRLEKVFFRIPTMCLVTWDHELIRRTRKSLLRKIPRQHGDSEKFRAFVGMCSIVLHQMCMLERFNLTFRKNIIGWAPMWRRLCLVLVLAINAGLIVATTYQGASTRLSRLDGDGTLIVALRALAIAHTFTSSLRFYAEWLCVGTPTALAASAAWRRLSLPSLRSRSLAKRPNAKHEPMTRPSSVAQLKATEETPHVHVHSYSAVVGQLQLAAGSLLVRFEPLHMRMLLVYLMLSWAGFITLMLASKQDVDFPLVLYMLFLFEWVTTAERLSALLVALLQRARTFALMTFLFALLAYGNVDDLDRCLQSPTGVVVYRYALVVVGYLFFASSFPVGEQTDLLRLLTHVLYYSLGKTHGVAGELTRAEPWTEAAQTPAYIYGLVLYFLTVLLGSLLTGIIINAFYMLREQVER